MTTLVITDNILTIDSTDIELPRLATDAKVHAWQVPTDYRQNGYFVGLQPTGHPREAPACDPRATTYLGAIDYPAHPPTAALAQLPAIRWQHETKGITWNGYPVATDDRSQAKLTGAMLGVLTGVRQDGADWKFDDGIARPITNTELQSMATAVSTHIQTCFDHEATLAEQLRNGQLPDITTGWPS